MGYVSFLEGIFPLYKPWAPQNPWIIKVLATSKPRSFTIKIINTSKKCRFSGAHWKIIASILWPIHGNPRSERPSMAPQVGRAYRRAAWTGSRAQSGTGSRTVSTKWCSTVVQDGPLPVIIISRVMTSLIEVITPVTAMTKHVPSTKDLLFGLRLAVSIIWSTYIHTVGGFKYLPWTLGKWSKLLCSRPL